MATTFVQTMTATMGEYLRMRAQGVSREDAERGIEAVLREAWPKRTTKFPPQCDECDDTGWAYHVCTHQMRCSTHAQRDLHPSVEHSYVTPCHCAKGDRHRKQARGLDDEIAAVGKVQRPQRSWRQVGR